MNAHASAVAVTIAAVTFTDLTCLEVTGAPWRVVKRDCLKKGVRIFRIGRRPCVKVADYLRALGADAEANPAPFDEEELIRRVAGAPP